MPLMVLDASVSPCNRLSNRSLSLLIDDLALATLWTVVSIVGIFVCLDEHGAAHQALLSAWM